VSSKAAFVALGSGFVSPEGAFMAKEHGFVGAA
jgi:hypothetical protein